MAQQPRPSPGGEDIAPEAGSGTHGGDAGGAGGIDPHWRGAVLDLAAVGLVNGVWRNSPVENRHADGGPLDDGAMLRLNTHTTWRVRQILRRWRGDLDLTSG